MIFSDQITLGSIWEWGKWLLSWLTSEKWTAFPRKSWMRCKTLAEQGSCQEAKEVNLPLVRHRIPSCSGPILQIPAPVPNGLQKMTEYTSPTSSSYWLLTCLFWTVGSITLTLALFLALWLLFVLETKCFLVDCDRLPWLLVLCAAFGRSLCLSSSSMDLDTGHLASTLARPALVPWDTMDELSRDDRMKWTVYRSPSV